MTRGQMYYQQGYSWTVIRGDDPRVSGPPDNTLLNRGEGYEVLYFVNKFSELNNLVTLYDQQKVERMIKLVPGHTHSQAGIKTWIEGNWSRH